MSGWRKGKLLTTEVESPHGEDTSSDEEIPRFPHHLNISFLPMDTVTIGADGINAAAIVESLRKRSIERMDNGEFDMDAISRAERYNIASVKDSDEFFSRFLSGIRLVSQVNINAWEIVEHRGSLFAPFSKFLKKTIWSLLRFYTYHLWSQQNRSNTLLHTAISVMSERNDERYAKMTAKIEALEKRIAELEAKGTAQ